MQQGNAYELHTIISYVLELDTCQNQKSTPWQTSYNVADSKYHYNDMWKRWCSALN